jgi:hypothetical protein
VSHSLLSRRIEGGELNLQFCGRPLVIIIKQRDQIGVEMVDPGVTSLTDARSWGGGDHM